MSVAEERDTLGVVYGYHNVPRRYTLHMYGDIFMPGIVTNEQNPGTMYPVRARLGQDKNRQAKIDTI